MAETDKRAVVMMGATGAVGGQALKALLAMDKVAQVTLLGRRAVEGVDDARVVQHKVDVFETDTYSAHLKGHQVAICALGVGEPSKMSKEDFVRVDKTAVLLFARACKEAGVKHFELLASVGADAGSASFYLRTKGELEEELKALEFDRLSLFHPSMILTPTNRYGVTQAITLKVWPHLSPVLAGPLKRFRGIEVEVLGASMAKNITTAGRGVEVLEWEQFQRLGR